MQGRGDEWKIRPKAQTLTVYEIGAVGIRSRFVLLVRRPMRLSGSNDYLEPF
jgi:hypothetical protein